MFNVNDIKNGMTILFEDSIYVVLEFSHVKPGKGAAFVQAKLKNLRTGSIVEKRFNSGVKLEKAMIEKKNMQYLYETGGVYTFMDNETYEQLELTEAQLGNDKYYLNDGIEVIVSIYEGEVLGVILPDKVELVITATEPAVKGNTTYNAQKDATDALSQLTDLTPRVKTNEDNIAALQENDRNLNDKFNNYLPLTGGKLTGSLIMDVNQTITIPNQPGENDNTLAVNKLYVDNSITDAKNDLTTKYQAADNQINANITALDTKIGNNTTAISNLTTKHNEDIESLSGEIENKSTVIFREWGD